MSKLKPGLHLTVPMEEYVADSFHALPPALSSRAAHELLEHSPLHAWYQHPRLNPHYAPDEAAHLDTGKVVHGILLEGSTSKIAVIHADDWRTKDAKEQRDEARRSGLTPILSAQMAEIDAMVTVAKVTIANSELAEIFAPEGGDSEATMLWNDNGTTCKSRPDRIKKDRRIIVDYKSTSASAEPSLWVKGPMLQHGFDLQAALGLRGVKALGLASVCEFIFIVQETFPPYAVSFVGFGGQFQFYADVRIQRAMESWKKCLTTHRWPGYPARVAWVSPPPWKTKEWEQQVDAIDQEGP